MKEDTHSSSNYMKVLCMVLAFVFYALWQDIPELIKYSDNDAAAFRLCSAALLSCIVWLTISNVSFKKKVLIGFAAIQLAMMISLLFNDISGHEMPVVLTATLGMAAIYFGFYKLGTRPKKASKRDNFFAKKELTKTDKAPDSLTETGIDGMDDFDLISAAFEKLEKKLPSGPTREYKAVLALPKPQQAIYVIWWFEAEVNNGGFNQYYFNSSGQYASLLPNALRLIGAKQFADLAERANATYKQEYGTITRHQDGTLEGFSKSYKDSPLEVYDDEFYALYENENLQQLQAAFIRAHKAEFVG